MKKMKLNLDQLRVESFKTSHLNKKNGTVKGNYYETNYTDYAPVCSYYNCITIDEETCLGGDHTCDFGCQINTAVLHICSPMP